MSDWSEWQAELERRQSEAKAMGGADKIKRQHDKGRLTARQRIEQLLDADSFVEYGELAAGNPPHGGPVPADGLVGGTGSIGQQAVVVMAEDFTVQGGSIGHVNSAKRVRLATLAGQQSLPLVFILDGAGERGSNALERYPRAPNDLQVLAQLKGKVPIIALVLGVSAGHGALAAAFADFVIMSQGASLFTAGPVLVKAALGKNIEAEELGGAELHTSESGVAHNLVATESEGFELCRQYLQHFSGADSPVVEKQSSASKIAGIVPTDTYTPYDMREVLRAITDTGSLLLLQPDFGKSICIALACIDGQSLMLVASQPMHLGGAINRNAADKASHWLSVATGFGLPVLFLADTPGVMPGPDAEREGTLLAAANFYQAQSKLKAAKVHVTVRKAFGFGSSLMAMNPFDDQLISMAFPNASLGAMPGDGAAEASGTDAADQLQLQQSAAWSGADNMAYDRVIAPDDLRIELIKALRITRKA